MNRYLKNQYSYMMRNVWKLGFKTYKEYLRSDLWKEIKLKAKQNSKYQTCHICGSINNLQLHHQKYNRKMRTTSLSCLISLCSDCHYRVHKICKERRKVSFKEVVKFLKKRSTKNN